MIQESHITYDINRLKVKGEEKIIQVYIANINQKETGVSILIR